LLKLRACLRVHGRLRLRMKEARLAWSKDSQHVAYFGPDRRGGTITVYFRNGSDFKEIALPQVPDCDAPAKQDGDEYLKHSSTAWRLCDG
jgi:hypothetical protein